MLNGDSSEDDEHVKVVLGTSKRQFEAQINRGFERNLPRYKKKNEEMMAMEWSNKVAASDRAEAKLYPVLSIDTAQYINRYQKNKRRNSIY
jgi:hypothetical protein